MAQSMNAHTYIKPLATSLWAAESFLETGVISWKSSPLHASSLRHDFSTIDRATSCQPSGSSLVEVPSPACSPDILWALLAYHSRLLCPLTPLFFLSRTHRCSSSHATVLISIYLLLTWRMFTIIYEKTSTIALIWDIDACTLAFLYTSGARG